jgi:tetratricopeptide (TPR) repeat protein
LYYDKALAIDPKEELTLEIKGKALDKLGNYTGALTYLDKALAIDPKDKDALYHKGVILDKLGNHTGAIEYYNKAKVIKSSNRAYILPKRGQFCVYGICSEMPFTANV